MANAFAQKHLRSIILNVSFRNKLYFVIIVLLLLITIITITIVVLLLKLLLSGLGTQNLPIGTKHS